ncbi:MAG TPA: ribosomal protein S18-alanine N-acetyltransferase [Marinagarivorans sp.]
MTISLTLLHPLLGELTSRALAIDDLPAVLAVEQRTHFTPWSEANLRSSINSSHLCRGLFTQDGAIAGYAVFSLVAGEAELLLFVIDGKHHGKGLGRLFLESLIEQLADVAQALFLEVRAGNQPAISLYENIGFNQVGERMNYYATPWGREDALVYALELDLLEDG